MEKENKPSEEGIDQTPLEELIQHLRSLQRKAITDSFFNGLQSGIDKARELLYKENEWLDESEEVRKQLDIRCSEALKDQQQIAELQSQLAQRDKEIEKWKDAFTSVNAQLKELRQEHNNWLQRESQYIDDKEKEIEGLNRVISKMFADKVDETRKLNEEINEYSRNLKNAVDRCGKLTNDVYQTEKQRDHYKALAEAAEVVFNSVGDFLKTNEWISKEYNAYQSLKNQTP